MDSMTSMKLIASANADILSFSVSFYYGIIQQCGAFWLAPHSIEKYFKAILAFHKPNANLKKLGHNLDILNKEVRSVYRMPDYISTLVTELNGVDSDFRYCDGDGYLFPDDLFYKVWVVGRWLRMAGNQLYDICSDEMFGVGLAFASPVLRTNVHNQLRELIREFESNTKRGKNYSMFSGWVDIVDETRAIFDHPS